MKAFGLAAIALATATAPLAAAELAATPRLGACGPAGGFMLPGTEACLTLSGFARAEAGWSMTAPAFALTTPGRGVSPQGPARAAGLD
ncbi:porin, partial [Lichenihabitans sp. Uapishka_5]|nr:porin [Lichenihabitans sp. Uapishka_5]